VNRKLWIINLLSLVVILIFGTLWAERTLVSFDLTEGRLYTLSAATKKIISNLKNPVTVKVFFSKEIPYPYNTISRYVLDILEDYKKISKGKIRVERVGPENEVLQRKATTYGIPPIQVNAIEGDQIKIKRVFLGLAFVSSDKIETIPVITDVSDLEYRITSTIKSIISKEKKTVGFLKGHSVQQCLILKKALEKQYKVKELELKDEDLKGIDLLIIPGPTEKFNDNQLLALDQFILKGGKVLFLVQRIRGDLQFGFATVVNTGLEKLLEKYGIEIPGAVLYDASAGMVNVSERRGGFLFTTIVPYPFFPKIIELNRRNIITKNVEALTLGYTAPINDKTSNDLRFIPLARTSSRSGVLRQPLYVAFDRKFPPGSFSGPPKVVAALVTGRFKTAFKDKNPKIKEGQSRIVIVGNAELATDEFINAPGNAQFLLNAIDYLVEDESLISIRSKQVQARPIKKPSESIEKVIRYTTVVLPPVLVFLTGIVIWSLRRSRRIEI